MKKYSLILGVCVFLVSGCSTETISKKPIYQESSKLMELIDGAQWELADKEVMEIQKLFKKNKWKYMLLGDETEYSGLNQEISKLVASIEEKDTPEAKRNILMIQDYIKSIYFH
ncbi:DUF4363 family protein [Bacillus timonensis]|uniref:DUF4363 family protein n=1 Tax=Bacillus timonensis TaxID=1033734 RepID=UPI000289DFA8|nr:DUF4363 family protein [Bacillus timonensis]